MKKLRDVTGWTLFCKPFPLEAGGERVACRICFVRHAEVAQLGHLHTNEAAGLMREKGSRFMSTLSATPW